MLIRVLVSCLLVTMFVACSPRGESNSLDQVFADSVAKFNATDKDNLPQSVSSDFELVKTSLEQLTSTNENVSKIAPKVAQALVQLSRHAGYTSRPALGELANQYLVIKDSDPKAATVKLLVSRTYSLLAEELGSTAFRL